MGFPKQLKDCNLIYELPMEKISGTNFGDYYFVKPDNFPFLLQILFFYNNQWNIRELFIKEENQKFQFAFLSDLNHIHTTSNDITAFQQCLSSLMPGMLLRPVTKPSHDKINTQEAETITKILPNEILQKIFSYLDRSSLFNQRKVCQNWKKQAEGAMTSINNEIYQLETETKNIFNEPEITEKKLNIPKASAVNGIRIAAVIRKDRELLKAELKKFPANHDKSRTPFNFSLGQFFKIAFENNDMDIIKELLMKTSIYVDDFFILYSLFLENNFNSTLDNLPLSELLNFHFYAAAVGFKARGYKYNDKNYPDHYSNGEKIDEFQDYLKNLLKLQGFLPTPLQAFIKFKFEIDSAVNQIVHYYLFSSQAPNASSDGYRETVTGVSRYLQAAADISQELLITFCWNLINHFTQNKNMPPRFPCDFLNIPANWSGTDVTFHSTYIELVYAVIYGILTNSKSLEIGDVYIQYQMGLFFVSEKFYFADEHKLSQAFPINLETKSAHFHKCKELSESLDLAKRSVLNKQCDELIDQIKEEVNNEDKPYKRARNND